MCDCFHMVLPTWPGAPGSVSGRQLQPEEPDAETEEDHSVTEGPVDEIIRPRPQGSSPVYECVTEGTSFRLPEDAPRRRRSWWKRDSGDSRTLSRMSHPEPTQEGTEVMLKTEVETGASGYTVTGGGDQGIFVKQVLKDSPAAKLFSLREGDQLLSTTIFFDGIKYEDALKILQYSEPYKVQFTVKRKLPAREDKEGASGSAQRAPRGSEEQDQETPTKMPQGDGDQERLISKPREGRGRRPQRERLSWPKFQALKSKRGPGPRRSHSTSEAYERGDAADLSPTSTDTESQLPAEEQAPEAGPGSQRRRRFPNLRFRVGSGKGLSAREAHAAVVQAEVLQEAGPRDAGQEDVGRAAEHGRREGRTAVVSEEAKPRTQPGVPGEGALGGGPGPEPRLQTKTEQAKEQAEAVPQGKAGEGLVTGQMREGARQGGEALETGIARLTLQEPTDQGSHQNHEPEIQIRIPTLKTPKFGFSKEKVLEKEGGTAALQQETRQRKVSEKDTGTTGADVGEADTRRTVQPAAQLPSEETEAEAMQKLEEERRREDQEEEGREGKVKMLFKLPSFGWSPAKEQRGDRVRQPHATDKEKKSAITGVTSDTDIKTKDGQEKESKFKMPKFKMPSFGVSSPSKSVETAVDASLPKAQAEVSLPSVPADVKSPEVSAELPSAELGIKLPEGQLPEAEPREAAAGIGLKAHLPKVQMPSVKVPKVDLKAPQVDIKGPKLDLKGAKAEVTAPEVGVSLPSVEVDTQVPGAKLEGDLSLGDKEVAARDSKFKMPKFKMPSFGVSALSKSVEAAVDASLPKAQAEVSLPSVPADVKSPEVSAELPSAELGIKLPEGQLPEAEPREAAAGIGLKAHLPKVQVPSVKVPKVDLKAPQVDIKGPKLDLKGAKAEVTAPAVGVSLPSVEVDTQVPGAKLEGDLSLGDKEVAARDSKFKMPKFKMPSFGVSAPSKSVEAAVDASLPKAQAEVSLPSVPADVKSPEVSAELPSAELGIKLPEGQLPEAEPREAAAGIGLKAHLPKVQVPSVKVPKVDLKAPQVDIKGPKLDLKGAKAEVTAPEVGVSLPSVEVDTQVPGAKLEGDLSLGDKEVAARDSKFKMPKFKMPSFGVSAPSKSVEAAVDASLPKAQAEVSLPSVPADVKSPEVSAELPSAELGIKLPEGQLPEAEPREAAAGIGLKAHLPKVQVPSVKVPKVDLKAPQVDIKGPKLDLKGAKAEVTAPEVGVSLPSVEVDTQVPGAKLEGDLSLGDKEVAARDSKFKMPKFKMPSFGVSAPSKLVEAAVDASLPKAQAEVSLPSVPADVKSPEVSAELPSAELGIKLPEGQLPEAEPREAAAGIGLKAHLPKVQVPSVKVPKVDLKAPQVDIKGPKLDLKGAKAEVTAPAVGVSLPSVEVDTQVPGAKLEGDLSLGDKEVAARDSKFKMPKFKMPSFGVSAPSKSVEAAVDASLPKAQAEVSLPSVPADVKSPEVSAELPSAELGIKLPEGQLPEAEPREAAAGIGLKAHLPKVQMPSVKVPKVDLKAPQVDIKGPKLDLKGAKAEVTAPAVGVSLPSVEVDTQVPGAKLEGDLSLGDKEVAARDSKFKMPKFKMPSFGVSAPSKSVEAAVDASLPKAQAEVSLPSVPADVKSPEVSAELPSAELGIKLPEGQLPEAEPREAAAGIGLKAHLPKVQMPSVKVPKVDLKAPQVDIKGPKLDLKGAKAEVTAPAVGVSLPSVEVDTQVPGAKLEGDLSLGDKEVAARDSKFKMPKFKMPSFGVSAPSKSVEAAVDASLPKAQAEVSLPSVPADVKSPEVSAELPSAELGIKLPEGQLPEAEPREAAAGIGLKAHLPKVQMPSVKVPKVDLKAPQVDIKGPKLDLKGAKAEVTAPEVGVSLPSVEVDTQVPGAKLEGDLSLGDKEVAARDSKFKMPKFKMPSFGVSAPSKSVEAAVDASLPKAQAEVSLPSVPADVKSPEVSAELPSAELGIKLPEGQLPEAEPREAAAGIGLKAHLPKVQVPSVKVPKVDLKAPQVDIKGPKLDLKGAKAKVTAPEVGVSLPSVEVDTQVPGAKLEGDLSLGDKEVAARDSKFKMPKFKMPSFGVSAPSKSVEAAVDASLPKAQAEVSLPSVPADVKSPEVSAELPSAELGIKLPEGQLPEAEPREAAAGIGLKAHLPKVQMPSVKVPKVDLKAPQVDIKGPKLDLKGAKAEVTAPAVGVSLPSVEVDTQVPGAKLEGDLSLGDKEVAARDSKFKMPKFKMPSFGVSAPSKSVEAAVDASLPKAQAEVSLPSVPADVKSPEVSAELPSAELGIKLPEGQLPEAEPREAAAGIGLKAHLPKVQVPSVKVPKVDLKAPQVDIKGPKLDLKGAKAEVTAPEVGVSLPSVEVDTQVPGAKLEGDLSLGDKEVAARDSKFKMPKFKMPSFGVSAPSKLVEAAVDASLPKAQAEVSLPSVPADVKSPEVSAELPSAELGIKLPEGQLPEAEPREAAAGIGLKAHLPKVQVPSVKVPKVDLKAPQVDIKGPKLDLKGAKAEVTAPEVGVSLPSVEVDTQVPGAKLEGDLSLGDKEVAARDSKFKMPKFKMPSFGVSAPSKSVEAAVDASLPKAQAEVSLPSVPADVKSPEVSAELPSAELGIKLPEGQLPEAEPREAAAGIGLKAHLPKVQMPSVKVPKVDLKAPQVDIKGPKLDLKGAKAEVTAPEVGVSLPSVEVDTQVPGAKLEGDLSLGDKEVAARDSKFKMPKFKMPSFGVSAPSKSVEAAVDASLPKAQAEVSLPSVPADVKSPEVSAELPSAELGIKLPEGQLPEAEPREAAAGIGLKAHLPKVQMPSVKVPKVDLKAPQVDIKGPKLDLKGAKAEVTAPAVGVSLPSVEVDTQVPGAKLEGDLSLGDKEVAARDSKFKMPKFKMPSFGVSAPSKSVEAAVDASLPKAQAEVSLPSVPADVKSPEVSAELPSAELGIKLPEGQLPEAEPREAAAGIGLKAHLPKVQMPSVKVPKVDLKAPQVDIKGPKLDLKGAKAEVTAPAVGVSLPSVEVDTQVPGAKLEGDLSLGDKEVAARDSKFKMPKFKMPSFGVSAPSKSVEAAVDASLPKAQAEVSLPSVPADVKSPEVSAELPSAELGIKLPEGQLPEAEPREAAAGIGLKAHLPKVQMPSVKVPKVDLKASQVDIKGPKLDLKGAKAEVTAPEVGVSLPSVEVDTQVPGAKLEGDLSLGDKEVAARDSKFKMPKFKMPSFGVSAPSKSVEAAVDASLPKAQAEVSLPSVPADVKSPEVSAELPSAELGIKLPEGQLPEAEPREAAAGIGLKAHLPKVQVPSVKVPKVDLKAPQVDIKGPKLDLKGAKAEVTAPAVGVSLPSVEVDTQVPGAKLEGDLSLGDKEVAARDSKFKMPKFKMPSFGVSAPSKSVEAAVDASLPKAQAEVSLPSVPADVKSPEVSAELPSAELGIKLPEGQLPEAEPREAAAGIGLKAHLPKVQVPSVKVPKVDLKAPQVDIKGPKLDLKGAKAEVTAPEVGVSLPSVEVDTQVPGAKLEGDLSLGDKEVAARDSKFKMPKFKMPSFGVSAPSKSVEAAVDASLPKAQAEVSLPSVPADVKSPEVSAELPSAELGIKLPEGQLPEAEPREAAAGIGLKAHLPKVQMPSVKVPKVDLKAPQVDIKGPKLDLKGAKAEVTAPEVGVSLPSVEVDTQVPGAKLEGDLSLGDKEVAARDSKFKMPKFKMPSFGVSAPSKSVEAAVDASLPKAQAEVSLPSVPADVKSPEVSAELPSAELGIKLPEGQLPEAEPREAAAGIGLKAHLPKVQMPSVKVPKVDLKAPQVDIKGPKLDLKGAKAEVTAPEVGVSLPSVEVDTQVPGAKLEGDLSLGDKEVAARDSKFKMPKFKMPSFGVSAPSKSVEAAVDASLPKAQAEVSLPSVPADVKSPEVSAELPSAELGIKLPEGQLPEAEPREAAAGIGLKAHLPKVQMPSVKVPKVDLKAPQVDIKGPKLDLKGAKAEVTAPEVGVSLPSVEVDTQVPGAKLEGDLSLGDKEVAARDSKFKMPKFKMPSFGVSAPSKSVEAAVDASLPKAQAEVSLPSVPADVKSPEVSAELPSAELGIKLPEGQLPEAEPREAAAGIGLKAHLPKVQMPSVKVPKVDLKAPQVDIKGPKLDLKGAKAEVTAPEVGVSLPSVEVDTEVVVPKPAGELSLVVRDLTLRDYSTEYEGVAEIPTKKSLVKFPKVFSSSGKSPKTSVVGCVVSGVPHPPPTSVLPSDFSTSRYLTQDLSTRETSLPFARLGWPGVSGSLDLRGSHPESSSLSPVEGITLTKSVVTLPGTAVAPELPLETSPGAENDACVSSTERPAGLPPAETASPCETDRPPGPVDPLVLASYGRVTFPTFHRPTFGFSAPEAADAEVEAGAVCCAPALSPPCSARVPDSPAVPGSAGPSVAAAGEAPAGVTERGGKGSPLNVPRIRLPSLRWSPKKVAGSPGDPARSPDDAELSAAVDARRTGALPVPTAELPTEAALEPREEAWGAKTPGHAVVGHAPPTVRAADGGPILPQGRPSASPSSPPVRDGSVPAETAPSETRAGGAGIVDPHLPQNHAPLLDFAKPDLRSSKATVGASLSAGGPFPKHGPSLVDGRRGHGLGDGSASQPRAEVTAPSSGDPSLPSCRRAEADAPAAESPGSPGGWFMMPEVRLPSVRRPARETGGAGTPGAVMPMPAACALREGEGPAPVTGQGVPGSEVEAATSLQPPKAGADEAAAEIASYADIAWYADITSYADVLKRDLEGEGSELHLPAAGVSAADLSTSEVRVRPGEGSLPLQMPSGRLSGTQASPGEMGTARTAGPAGPDLASREGRAKEQSSQPEGPVKLKASRTAGPSQVSVVNVGQPLEGSVVTVKLPRLSVPRFAFPDPSSEADIFIPTVTEVQCPGRSLDDALLAESPGAWGARILKAGSGTPGEQPVALDLSPEASPISKVRAHVQGAQGESPEVTIHSRVIAALADPSGPEAVPTRIVRESQIPSSEIQTASYGFSLLKVKIPEPPTQGRVQGSRPREGLQEAPRRAARGADAVSGDPQPDAGEPWEAISPGAGEPRRPAFSPEVRSGHQGADSCSDEEPAEILEFPPEEDSGEAAAPLAEGDRTPKEKPEGKRSGLFRFWLPNIGFSSSTEETHADSRDEGRGPAPVQTQPGPQREAELPKKPEKVGWFRFPKLGFSSSPTKKSKSSEDEAALADPKLQEEAITFFDAQESFSPEDKEGGEPPEAAGTGPGARVMVTSAARTELILLEQDPEGRDEPAPGPAAK